MRSKWLTWAEELELGPRVARASDQENHQSERARLFSVTSRVEGTWETGRKASTR